jgi:hypothetical protein
MPSHASAFLRKEKKRRVNVPALRSAANAPLLRLANASAAESRLMENRMQPPPIFRNAPVMIMMPQRSPPPKRNHWKEMEEAVFKRPARRALNVVRNVTGFGIKKQVKNARKVQATLKKMHEKNVKAALEAKRAVEKANNQIQANNQAAARTLMNIQANSSI